MHSGAGCSGRTAMRLFPKMSLNVIKVLPRVNTTQKCMLLKTLPNEDLSTLLLQGYHAFPAVVSCRENFRSKNGGLMIDIVLLAIGGIAETALTGMLSNNVPDSEQGGITK
jgi:hypothetical protein